MRCVIRTSILLCTIGQVLLSHAHAEQRVPPKPPELEPGASAKEIFEANCSACHSLDLPTSQRLDRKTWRWVVDDMVNQYGATWLTPEQQETIIDYLAENYGPNRPR